MGCTGLGIDFSLTVRPISGIRHFSFAEPTNVIEEICKQASHRNATCKRRGKNSWVWSSLESFPLPSLFILSSCFCYDFSWDFFLVFILGFVSLSFRTIRAALSEILAGSRELLIDVHCGWNGGVEGSETGARIYGLFCHAKHGEFELDLEGVESRSKNK